MGYRLDPARAIDEELRRVLTEEIDAAVRVLREPDDEATHEARKHLKKARALLRLVRPHVPLQFDELNARFRDCGRALAPARDAESMREGWERLRPRFGGDPLFSKVADALAAGGASEENRKRAADVVQRLEGAEGISASRLPGTMDAFAAGMLMTLTTGRRRFSEARASRSVAAFHEWRKRTKDLWYHVRLLRMDDPLLRAWEQLLGELSTLLGERHDLDLLRERLADGSLALTAEEAREVDLFLREEGERLSRQALILGSLAFGRNSGAVVDAVIDAWSQVAGLSRVPALESPATTAE